MSQTHAEPKILETSVSCLVELVIFVSTYEPPMMEKFVLDMCMMLSTTSGTHSILGRELSDRIETRLVQDSKAYLEFESRAKSRSFDGTTYSNVFDLNMARINVAPEVGHKGEYYWFSFPLECTQQQIMSIPILHGKRPTDKNIPFSMYSSLFFARYPDTPMLIMLDYSKFYPERKLIVQLRSPEGQFNCYDIAKLNGGGGHPRAAGFTIKCKDSVE